MVVVGLYLSQLEDDGGEVTVEGHVGVCVRLHVGVCVSVTVDVGVCVGVWLSPGVLTLAL